MVTGATGAIGQAFVEHLNASRQVERVLACSRRPPSNSIGKIQHKEVDIENEASIETALHGVRRLDLIIVATGFLHQPDGLQPEKSWRSLNKTSLLHNFAINTIGPALIAKHTLPLMPKGSKAVFAALSARVGSISDNRLGGWYSYRSSKAALNQIIRTLSIELARKRPEAICVGLHPGTVDSGMSEPFQENLAEGQLTTPKLAAERLLAIIDALDPSHSGQQIAWDGKPVPP